MPYYLGIDGGGTKTICAVGDAARLLATATSGPSNIVRVGEAQARASLQEAVRQACAAAGIAPEQVAYTYVGASGAGRSEVAEIVRRMLAEILSTPIDVSGDMQIALEAAFDTGPGVIVNAGTGSFAYGRNPQGKTARAGGWGFAISDEGSAHWIGRAAVGAVLRAADGTDESSEARRGLQQSAFLSALFKAWGVTTIADLARAANSIPPADFSALFSAVATAKDDLATQVLTAAGRGLARMTGLVIRRLFTASHAEAVPLAITGSVFRQAPLARDVFYNELRQLDSRIEARTQIVEPVEGALRLARRAAACGTDNPVRRF